MEQWYIRSDGMVENKKGRTLPISKIQDQIDDGRIEVIEKPAPVAQGLLAKTWEFLNTPII